MQLPALVRVMSARHAPVARHVCEARQSSSLETTDSPSRSPQMPSLSQAGAARHDTGVPTHLPSRALHMPSDAQLLEAVQCAELTTK